MPAHPFVLYLQLDISWTSTQVMRAMPRTKTTFYLSDPLRRKLKELALERTTTVTELLREGAELVLAQRQKRSDRDKLRRRAREARTSLRHGLYEGASLADRADELVYGKPGRG